MYEICKRRTAHVYTCSTILMIVKPRSGTWNENFFGKWKVMCGIYALFITKCNISLEWSTKTS